MKITKENGETFHSPSIKFAALLLHLEESRPVAVELDFFEKSLFQDEDAGAWIYSRMNPAEQKHFVQHVQHEYGLQLLSKLRSMLETM
jgi:hypothetical protein